MDLNPIDLDRRGFLARSAWLAAGVTFGGLLSGCSSDDETAAGGDGPAAEGGVLRMAVLGGPNDTLDLGSATTTLPFIVNLNVCDSLALLRGGDVQMSLAERIEPNEDATVWTVQIRDDAVFHDGAPVTAADVAASLGYLAQSATFGSLYADLDPAATVATDDVTVQIALTRPRADLIDAVLALASIVLPGGTPDSQALVASGPFRLESFSPDTGAVLVRNEDYWGNVPLLERVEIRSVPDITARTNALTSGEVDYIADLSVTAAQTLTSSQDQQVVTFGAANSEVFAFALNSRVAPFDDPEVRRAVRLAVDREQLLSVVCGEYGQVGNDLFGLGLPGYADDIAQRRRDVEGARAVLTAKGVTELTILAVEFTSGVLDSAELLVQQLAEVGVTATVTEADPATFFTDTEALGSAQVIATFYANRPVAAQLPGFAGASSPFSFDGWSSPAYEAALLQSQTVVDPEARAAALVTAQELQHEQGGLVIWGYRLNLAGARVGLNGVALSQSVPLLQEAGFQ